MAEDHYDPGPRRIEFFSGRWSGKTLMMKQQILVHAANSPTGVVNMWRMDRETKKWVCDKITADMPIDEIIL